MKHDSIKDALVELVRRARCPDFTWPNGSGSTLMFEGALNDAEAILGGRPPAAERLPPIPMRLHCPACSTLHVDVGEFSTKPHHTHACQACGMCWRPAIVPTVGVQFLPGFKDL